MSGPEKLMQAIGAAGHTLTAARHAGNAASAATQAAEEEGACSDMFDFFRSVEPEYASSTRFSRRFLSPMLVLIMICYGFYTFYEWETDTLTASEISLSNSGCSNLGTLSIGDDARYAFNISAIGASTKAANPSLPATLTPGSGSSVSLEVCIGSETWIQADPLNNFSPLSTAQSITGGSNVIAYYQSSTDVHITVSTTGVSITDGSYQYIGVSNGIVKMSLVTGDASTTNLTSTPAGAVYDAGFGYFKLPGGPPPADVAPSLVKIDLSSMTQVGSLNFPASSIEWRRRTRYNAQLQRHAPIYYNVSNVYGAAATFGTFGYFGFNSRIYKVRLSTMVVEAYLQLQHGTTRSPILYRQVVSSGTIGTDGRYGYNCSPMLTLNLLWPRLHLLYNYSLTALG